MQAVGEDEVIDDEENMMPPHRYSVGGTADSPSAYEAFAFGDNRRTSQTYSPFRASPAAKKTGNIDGASSAGKASSGLQSAIDKRKRQLSVLTSGWLAKMNFGSTVAPANDYEASSPDGGSPPKRGRRAVPVAESADGVSAKAPALAAKWREGVAGVTAKLTEAKGALTEAKREASTALTEAKREASTKVASAQQTLQAAAKNALQAVDDEADAVFDGVEQSLERAATAVRAATANATVVVKAKLGVSEGSRASKADGATGGVGEAAAAAEGGAATELEGETAEEEDAAATAADAALTGLVDSVKHMSGRVEERLVAAEESLIAAGDAMGASMSEGLESLSAVGEGMNMEAVQEKVHLQVAQARERVATKVEALQAQMSVVGESVPSLETVSSKMGEVEATLDDAVDKAVEDAASAASSAVSSVVERLSDSFPQVSESVKELSAAAEASNAFLKESLSQVADEFANDMQAALIDAPVDVTDKREEVASAEEMAVVSPAIKEKSD